MDGDGGYVSVRIPRLRSVNFPRGGWTLTRLEIRGNFSVLFLWIMEKFKILQKFKYNAWRIFLSKRGETFLFKNEEDNEAVREMK